MSEDNPVLSGGEKHYELRLAAVLRILQRHIGAELADGTIHLEKGPKTPPLEPLSLPFCVSCKITRYWDQWQGENHNLTFDSAKDEAPSTMNASPYRTMY